MTNSNAVSPATSSQVRRRVVRLAAARLISLRSVARHCRGGRPTPRSGRDPISTATGASLRRAGPAEVAAVRAPRADEEVVRVRLGVDRPAGKAADAVEPAAAAVDTGGDRGVENLTHPLEQMVALERLADDGGRARSDA